MKKQKAPRLVTVAVFTTITLIFWVFMSLYEIITSTPDIEVDPELLKPIDPTLDQEALVRLDNRLYFEEGQTHSPSVIKEVPEPTQEIIKPTDIPEEEIPTELTPTPYY